MVYSTIINVSYKHVGALNSDNRVLLGDGSVAINLNVHAN